MPELPEVETVCRGLEQSILGKTIEQVEVMRPDLRIPFPDNLAESLHDQAITTITRRSKYILMTLSNQLVLIMHLGMSGKILIREDEPETIHKHDHLLIRFSDDSWLIFHDPRRFGLVTLANAVNINEHPLLAHLGPEPLSNDFTVDYLYSQLKQKHTPIKHAIMDASLVVGVGNIYASESLFRAGVRPTRACNKVTKPEVVKLVASIREVLQEAIASGGSTLRDYVRSDGDLGYFQHRFNVYGRADKPCLVCTTPIKQIKQQNRSSFYCPNCQK